VHENPTIFGESGLAAPAASLANPFRRDSERIHGGKGDG
jgi:hypothetical protein